MGNVLSKEKREQVLALGRLGWTLRRIGEATGVRRETASGYLKEAGIAVRAPGRWGREAKSAIAVTTDSAGDSKPANEVSTDSVAVSAPSAPGRAPTASACEPYHEEIKAALENKRNAVAIYQDLVTQHGFTAKYASVRRFVHGLRGDRPPEPFGVITTTSGEEAQVDYGDGPMVRDPMTGKYRRVRLFVLTLGYSRKAVRLLTWKSSSTIWAQLHEEAFRCLGGTVCWVVLDNLREGVLKPDIYDPDLNPLYRDVLRHYGVVALPARVRDPNRKGKVESAIGHTKRTPLKGMRFESIEAAQTYLDRWDRTWADTRIHGTTKRQVAAMFAEEQPALKPLPVEPFRYYAWGMSVGHAHGTPRRARRGRRRVLRGAARSDRNVHPRAVGRALRAAPGSSHGAATTRARSPAARPVHAAQRDQQAHAAHDDRAARAHEVGGQVDRRARGRDTWAGRPDRRAPHPGPALARAPEVGGEYWVWLGDDPDTFTFR